MIFPPQMQPLERRTLLADPPMLSINVKKADASETDPAGAGLGQFTVRHDGSAAGDLDVSVRVSPGASTATEGEDFHPVVKTVRIPRGRAYAHFSLTPIDDDIADWNEMVVMKVHSSQAYTINPARPKVRIRIEDNEPVVGVFATDATMSEDDPGGAGRGELMVRRTGPIHRPLTVGLYLHSVSTASRADLHLPAEVTIPAGQSEARFALSAVDDELEEGPETAVVTLRFDPGITRFPHSARFTLEDNDSSRAGWWDDRWNFRLPIHVNAGQHERNDRPVERRVNFTELFAAAGRPGALIEQSLRVIETSPDGLTVLDDDVPFQFDRDAGFHATTNATGTLVFLLKGNTPAGQQRHYHVYFDNAGSFNAPSFSARVITTDNVMDEGFASVRVATSTATYFYQKAEGGFSSIVDTDGNDWISWNAETNPGSAGAFRGVPNLGPAGFHPGADHDVSTVIVSQGPLKAVIESTDPDGNNVRWEFFPTFARATIVSINQPYYFLYEGTPGGAIDSGDFVVRSDGTQTEITTPWRETNGLGSGNGQSWVYFGDGNLNRFFYLAHHEADNLEDSYFNLDNHMTVFGFGRRNNPGAAPSRLMTAQNNTFTIGLGDGTAYASAAARINGSYRNVVSSQDPPQTRR